MLMLCAPINWRIVSDLTISLAYELDSLLGGLGLELDCEALGAFNPNPNQGNRLLGRR